MARVRFNFWLKQSRSLSTSNFIIWQITAVSMLKNFIIPWLTTRMVIYPCHRSCFPAPRWAMLSCCGKTIKAFISKIPSQSRKQTDLIARTTSIPRMTVVRPHPADSNVSPVVNAPCVPDTYILLMNTWNTLPESYPHRVYNNTLATVKHQIQQAENPMAPVAVITMEAACVDLAILLDCLTSKVALEEPETGIPYPNIPIDNTDTDDELHFGMPGGSGD